MPETGKATDRTKVLSVRLTSDEFAALAARATEVGVGPSTLARTMVRSALALGTSDPTDPSTPSSQSRRSKPPESAATAGAQLSALETQLVEGLAARIGALERWVAEH
ncbi:hypothetical protein [Terrabacter sp. 2RAF25]|uniref:hypothetical protein n=1 Tax=Terrabacter sp. 2RAF25 TaxID=3232998 RepID=UPI003F9A1320